VFQRLNYLSPDGTVPLQIKTPPGTIGCKKPRVKLSWSDYREMDVKSLLCLDLSLRKQLRNNGFNLKTYRNILYLYVNGIKEMPDIFDPTSDEDQALVVQIKAELKQWSARGWMLPSDLIIKQLNLD